MRLRREQAGGRGTRRAKGIMPGIQEARGHPSASGCRPGWTHRRRDARRARTCTAATRVLRLSTDWAVVTMLAEAARREGKGEQE